MNLTFHGGAQEVGKSLVQLEAKGHSVVFDCGMKLSGEKTLFPPLPPRVDSLIISHCHLDHSGMSPALWRQRPLPIYATDLTFEISHLLHKDSIKIAKNKKEYLPYAKNHIERMISSEIAVSYEKERRILGDFSLELVDAGHIPGSASILLGTEEKKILFSGDVRYSDTRLQKAGQTPKADILVLESTYGDRNHPPREDSVKEFTEDVKKTLEQGGVALLPAFAVGRSQEVLMMLFDADINYPIYIDGMSQTVTNLYLQFSEYLADIDKFNNAAKQVNWVRNHKQRKKIVNEPCAIITTAGMLEGGPVMSYIPQIAQDKKSSIILTGYQVEGTNGRTLVEKGYIEDEYDSKIPVGIEVKQYDFSAHADQAEMLDAIKKIDPEKVFTMHGDPEVLRIFAEKIKETGREVVNPELGSSHVI
ncbi:MAG: MBL fold metallo-hydrolase [Candidatus Altiarchaeota archaeon]